MFSDVFCVRVINLFAATAMTRTYLHIFAIFCHSFHNAEVLRASRGRECCFIRRAEQIRSIVGIVRHDSPSRCLSATSSKMFEVGLKPR